MQFPVHNTITGVGKIPHEAFGIEVEIEYRDDIPSFGYNQCWSKIADHSLRDGVEYVSKVLVLDKLDSAIAALGDVFEEDGPTPRMSTHVHLNCTHMPIFNIYQGIINYYLLEPLLIESQGVYRKGNIFCLSLEETYGLVEEISNSLNGGRFFYHFDEPLYKYGAVNLASVQKRGTVEFRFLKGSRSAQDIKDSVNTVFHLFYELAAIPTSRLVGMIEQMSARELLLTFYDEQLVDTLLSRVISDPKELLERNIDDVMYLAKVLDSTTKKKPVQFEQNEDDANPHTTTTQPEYVVVANAIANMANEMNQVATLETHDVLD